MVKCNTRTARLQVQLLKSSTVSAEILDNLGRSRDSIVTLWGCRLNTSIRRKSQLELEILFSAKSRLSGNVSEGRTSFISATWALHRYQIVVFVAKIWAFKVRYLFWISTVRFWWNAPPQNLIVEIVRKWQLNSRLEKLLLWLLVLTSFLCSDCPLVPGKADDISGPICTS